MNRTTDSLTPSLAWESLHATLTSALPPRQPEHSSPLLVTHGHAVVTQAHDIQIVFQFATRLTTLPVARHGQLTCRDGSSACQVIDLTEQYVTLSFREQDHPKDLSHGTLLLAHSDSSEGLRRRFQHIQAQPARYGHALATKVFSSHQVPSRIAAPKTPEPTPGLNLDQRQAYERALTDDLLYIWGPPGTGKTTVIAQILRTAITHGQRILLCATTNAAVDGALAQLHTCAPDLEGSMLRVGTPSPTLADQLTPLTLEQRIEQQAAPLRTELEDILTEQGHWEHERTLLQAYQDLERQWIQIMRQRTGIAGQLAIRTQRLQALHSQISQTHTALTHARRRFHRSRLWRSRLLTFLWPGSRRRCARTIHVLSHELANLEEQFAAVTTEQNVLLGEQDETDALLGQLATERHALPISLETDTLTDQLEEIDRTLADLDQRQTAVTTRLQTLSSTCLKSAQLIATTLTRSSSSALFHDQQFDLLLVDEVSLASLPQLWATTCLAHTQVILVGDLLQLPPITTPHLTDHHDPRLFGSIYEWAAVTHATHPLLAALHTQYRMHPEIMALSSALYRRHGLTYRTAPALLRTVEPLVKLAPFPGTAVCWVDTTEAPLNHSRRDASHSPANWYHALILLRLIRQALTASEGHRMPTLAVMSPYRAQVSLLQRLFAAVHIPQTVRVGTIHQFQGQQADLTFLDTTVIHGLSRSLLCRETTGMSATKLLNVAVTRARGKALFIGAQGAVRALPEDSFLRHCLRATEAHGMLQETNDWPLPSPVTPDWFLDAQTTEHDFLARLALPDPSHTSPSALRLVS